MNVQRGSLRDVTLLHRCALGSRPRDRSLAIRALAVLLLIGGLLCAPAHASAAVTARTSPQVSDGPWLWPLSPQPTVEHAFDAPDGPFAAGHRGVDLLGRIGQAVRAVDEATVAYAGRVGGIGVVSLQTAAGRVTYQPVSAAVRRGDTVEAGSVVGHLLDAGSHCLPQACLHLGLIVAGEYQDPLRLLGGGAVRLLPLNGAPPGALGPPDSTGSPPAARLGVGSAPPDGATWPVIMSAEAALSSWQVGTVTRQLQRSPP